MCPWIRNQQQVRRAGDVSPLNRRACARIAAALGAAIFFFSFSSPTSADDAEQLDRFLARLGLVDLQILHLEQSLASQADGESQLKFARQLADLYAARLMDLADDPQRYDEMLGSIQQLVAKHPQANTTALGVMLLQADYNRAETLVGQWMAAPDEPAPRDQAAAILARISPQLQSQQQELNEQAESIGKEHDE
jgi:hypothetical protein